MVSELRLIYFDLRRLFVEKVLAPLIRGIPGTIVTWAYPWIAKQLLQDYVGGIPNAEFICQKLVDSFANPPATIDPMTTVPEEAFAYTMQQAFQLLTGAQLAPADMGPLMVAIGQRGLADPDLAEPVA